jgi:hypothetical protein
MASIFTIIHCPNCGQSQPFHPFCFLPEDSTLTGEENGTEITTCLVPPYGCGDAFIVSWRASLTVVTATLDDCTEKEDVLAGRDRRLDEAIQRVKESERRQG